MTDALETILRAATREFIECPSWRPKLLAAWNQLEKENGAVKGWGSHQAQVIAETQRNFNQPGVR